LEQTGTDGPTGGNSLDTATWFDSHVPPAAQQSEAANLRASDDDPDTRDAHAGLPD
jgi:hypothetical protein